MKNRQLKNGSVSRRC